MYKVDFSKKDYRYTIMHKDIIVLETNTVEILHSVMDLLHLFDNTLVDEVEDDEMAVLLYKDDYRIIIDKYCPEYVLNIEM
jgi:hypothetical protein